MTRHPSVRWSEFAASSPALEETARRLLYPLGPSGPGLGFLATTRADGGPRVHPVCPGLFEGGLYVYVTGTSRKRFDLERDGRYALHAYPAERDDESFYCMGSACAVLDPAFCRAAQRAVVHHVKPDDVLFELRLERVLHTTWLKPRTPETSPVYHRWRP